LWKVDTRVESDWLLQCSINCFQFRLRPDREGALSIAAGWFASFGASMVSTAAGQAWPFNEHPKMGSLHFI
jgi:hypothetical protein